MTLHSSNGDLHSTKKAPIKHLTWHYYFQNQTFMAKFIIIHITNTKLAISHPWTIFLSRKCQILYVLYPILPRYVQRQEYDFFFRHKFLKQLDVL